MTEKLLQFIWQFQYYNTEGLTTADGQPVQVLHPGQLNTHQGPDFFNGRVKIGPTEWAGHIELHLRSSHWYKHRHQHDPTYGKVILHVVWQHDAEVTDENGNDIPVLSLENRIAGMLLDQYAHWMNNPAQIPCAQQLHKVPALTWKAWMDRLLAERLLEKCSRVSQQVAQTEGHWEEVCWRMVCTYFGGPVNKESFQQVAESLPLTLLGKHKNVLPQLEALLLGQAGLLHKHFTDDYPQMLYREYQFLQKKYSLRVINKPPVFLRMRPVDFPTVRLAQLAALLHHSTHLFSQLAEAPTLQQATQLFYITANDYWHTHYKPDAATPHQPKATGKSLADRLIINAVIPVLFAYGHHMAKDAVRQKALQWLEELPAEKNQVTRLFDSLGHAPARASESQALLTLKAAYCDAKRCLHCAAGNYLLKHSTT